MFLLKKSEKESWQRTYNCDYCLSKDFHKERECFIFSKYLEIPIINFDFEKGDFDKQKEVEFDEINKETFFDEIAELHPFFPKMDVVEFVLAFYGGLCPQSLLTNEGAELVSIENAVSKYHSLPFEGAYLSQPYYIIQAFEIIRGTIIGFENKMLKEASKSKD